MKNIIFLLFAATLSPSIYALSPYNKGDTLNVLALSGLRLRDKPGGKVIATLPYGSKVVMKGSDRSDGRDTVENIPGRITKVIWDGKEGYVFDGFLSVLPAPDTSVKNLAAYCNKYFRKVGEPIIFMSTHYYPYPEKVLAHIQHYRYKDFQIELKTKDPDSDETQVKLTVDKKFLATDLFLVSRAIFRHLGAASLKMPPPARFAYPEENARGSDAEGLWFVEPYRFYEFRYDTLKEDENGLFPMLGIGRNDEECYIRYDLSPGC